MESLDSHFPLNRTFVQISTIMVTFSSRGSVPTDPSTNPVDQPIDLLAIRPAHTTCNTVCIWARPIDLQINLLFNRPQGLDCTWPRLGSASQVCFENSPALRTLTTSTFKREEDMYRCQPRAQGAILEPRTFTYRPACCLTK